MCVWSFGNHYNILNRTYLSQLSQITPIPTGVSEYLVCQFPNGTSCPKVVCPNTTLNFICNIKTQQLGNTMWLPNGTCRDNPYPDRIALLQPLYAGCNPSSSSQHGTCGPFSAQTVATSRCVNSSLSVIATQQLNGAEVKCINYGGHNHSPVGNATIPVVGTFHDTRYIYTLFLSQHERLNTPYFKWEAV